MSEHDFHSRQADESPVVVPSPSSAIRSEPLFHDFETEMEKPGTGTSSPVVPTPVVIVGSRSRSWWSPIALPLLIVLAFVVLVLRLPEPKAWTPAIPSPSAEPVEKPSAALLAPVIVKIQPTPDTKPIALPAESSPPVDWTPIGPPATTTVADAAPERQGPPGETDPPVPNLVASRPDSPPALPDPAVLRRQAEARRDEAKALAVETENAMEAIRREAETRRAQKDEARALIEQQPILEARRQQEFLQLIEEQRVTFRSQVKRLIDQFGENAGSRIWELAERMYVDVPPQAEAEIARDLKAHAGQLSRAGRVQLFRRHGLPEPIILAELYRDQMKLGPARNGPRNRNDAVVRAARQLLAIPIDRAPVTAATGEDRLRGTQ